jgi:hypothetical protein
MSTAYSTLPADVSARTVAAFQEAHATALAAGFDLAGKLLEQQRAYTVGVVDAFAKAASPREG